MAKQEAKFRIEKWFHESGSVVGGSCAFHVLYHVGFLRKKSKQLSHSKNRYTTTIYFFKTYIDNASVVPENEYKTVGTIKGPNLLDCLGTSQMRFMSLTNRKLCVEIQKLSTILPKYLESSRFFEQKDRTNWSVLESYQGKNKSHPFEVIHVTGNVQQASNKIVDFLLLHTLSFRVMDYKARSGYISNNEDPQSPRPKKSKFIDENVVDTNIMPHVKRKIILTNEKTDTNIQKRPGTKTCRKKNGNFTSTLLEELAFEAVSSSQKGGEAQTSKEQSIEEQDLVSLVGPSFKNPKLVALLNDKDTSRNHKESLCLLWFVHNGHDSCELTVKYLLDPLSLKTNNLFGCPWAFMACTFEVIPHLKHQVTAKKEISSPKILRCLTAKNVKNSPNLFNPPDDAVSFYITNFKLSYVSNVVTDEAYVATNESFVVADAPYVAMYHPYVATCDTSVTTCDPNIAIDDSYVATYHPSIAICDPNIDIDDSYIASDDPFVATWLVETLFDHVVDIIKRELLGETTIKKARVDDQAGVIIGVGAGINFGGQSVGATSCSLCFGFLCEKYKKHEENSIMYLQTLSQEENRSFIKAIQNLKKKIFRELPMVVGEKLLELKQVNLYKHVPIAQKNKLLELMRVKNIILMKFLASCGSHLRYPEYYDSTDRIIDLNFYTNFKQRCDNISKEATTIGGRSFIRLINEFVWNDDMIDYVRLYPGGMD
ncbi:hypothetical protein H5410_026929 [Solanum commersonii]|uniref:Uncharacterized protein n=1 Tax=Solanum commersonii TaxID=4109 RepID=A0A9J5YZW7_SOLCO|nr:hypothetical protein H5410_026929 [Solanum commersonii]